MPIDFSKLELFGVTGTNGKTTTAFLMEGILAKAGKKPGLVGTVVNRFGAEEFPTGFTTPPVEKLYEIFSEFVKRGAQTVSMEVSSHGLVQSRIKGCVFRSTLFTNLTQDHLDYHKTMEEYFAAKLKLFTDYPTQTRVIHTDDAHGAKIVEELKKRKLRFLTYGSKNTDLDYGSLESTAEGITGNLRGVEVKSPLIGAFNKQNITGAVLCMLDYGIDPRIISKALSEVCVPGRMERVSNARNYNVVVDYAHTPDALEKALHTLRPLVSKNGRLIVVFGCGGDRDKTKRPVMGRIASTLADHAWITSDNPRGENPQEIIEQIHAGVQNPKAIVHIESDRRKAIQAAANELKSTDDFLLIAGKGHENYQIIGTEKLPFDDRLVAREYLS